MSNIWQMLSSYVDNMFRALLLVMTWTYGACCRLV